MLLLFFFISCYLSFVRWDMFCLGFCVVIEAKVLKSPDTWQTSTQDCRERAPYLSSKPSSTQQPAISFVEVQSEAQRHWCIDQAKAKLAKIQNWHYKFLLPYMSQNQLTCSFRSIFLFPFPLLLKWKKRDMKKDSILQKLEGSGISCSVAPCDESSSIAWTWRTP